MSSLRHIARELGLSAATVSAGLRGLPGVKADTRERIMRAADARGYKLHPMVTRLMGELRRSRADVFRGGIAFLQWDKPEPDSAAAARRRRIFAGAEQAAGRMGFTLHPVAAGEGGFEREKIRAILDARGMNGVLHVFGGEAPAALSRGAVWPGLPALSLDGVIDGLDAVMADRAGALRLALAHLEGRGALRPALLLRDEAGDGSARSWAAAYRAWRLEREDVAPTGGVFTAPADVDRLAGLLGAGVHDGLVVEGAWSGDQSPTCRVDICAAAGETEGVDLDWESVGRRGVELLADRVLRRNSNHVCAPTTTLCRPVWGAARFAAAPLE